ncbi:phosphatase domain-containing protein [Chitiniphilus shinanonensis]|uniref:phosphatase domain-containing protein n=1 Tax=Chitiniphilus shinanonensis TaxID=553088 RepID=UPI00302DFC2F
MRAPLLLGLTMAWSAWAWGDDGLHNTVDDAVAGAGGFVLAGRVTEARTAAHPEAGRLHALYRSARQLLTDGEHAEVSVRIGQRAWRAEVDDGGYWQVRETAAPAPGWHPIDSDPPPSSDAGLLVPSPLHRVGIVSDVDDTVMVSEVNDTHRLLGNSLTLPPEQRLAVPGLAALYAGLVAATPHPPSAPLFYLSASPRQFTDNLRRFFAANGFPRGVLLAKRLGEGSLTDQRGYKMARLTALFDALPTLRFVLFGDDGEQDPEIYAALAERYPGRVLAIWIRRVNPDPARPRLPGQGDLAQLLADPRLLDIAAGGEPESR